METKFGTTYLPQIDDQFERTSQILEGLLRSYRLDLMERGMSIFRW